MLGVFLFGLGCINFYADVPCEGDGDCPAGLYCGTSAFCGEVPAAVAGETGDSTAVATCPGDVVVDLGVVTIDVYEASRADASAASGGTDGSLACSVAGVIPWYGSSSVRDGAAEACAAAGKRLCTQAELGEACLGAQGTPFPYGETYLEGACNVRGDGPSDPVATGTFPQCTTPTGVFDLVGNVIDWSADNIGYGGYFDTKPTSGCGSSSYMSGAIGFRCCQ